MTTMLYLTVTSVKLVVYVMIISCASGQTRNDGTVSLLCNDQLVYGYTHDPYHCHLVSPHPMTWRDAHTFCRSRGGWLQKCVSCDQEGSDTAVSARLLIENDVHSLWTGFYVRDYRLLQDQYPIPERPQAHAVFYGEWVESSTAQGTCIREFLKTDPCLDENGEEDSKSIDQLKDFSNLAERKKGQAKEPKVCHQVYTREFVSCAEKHNFICLFKGYEAQIELPRFAAKEDLKWINQTDTSTSKMFNRTDLTTLKMFNQSDLSTLKMFKQIDLPTLEMFSQTDLPTIETFGQTDSPTLEMFNQTDSPTLKMFNETDSPILEIFNETDSPTLEMFNQTDLPTLQMFNETDSPSLEMFNETDSPTLKMFNQTDLPTLQMFNQTDLPTLEMFNQTDSPTLEIFNQTDSPTLEIFNQTDSPTLEIFNQTDSPTLEIFNQTDSPTLKIFNQRDSPTLETFNQEDSPTLGNVNQIDLSTLEMFSQTHSPTLELFNQTDSSTLIFNQTNSSTLEIYNQTDSPALDIFNQTDSPTLEVFNHTDLPTLQIFNQTDSSTFEVFNQSDSPTLDIFNQTDSPTLEVFNHTDSPALEMFNQTDSPMLEVFNQSDSPSLEMFNETDSATASIMFNQTDSPTSKMFNKTDSPSLEMFNQTDSTTASITFNQTDSPTLEMFNQTDSTTASIMFNQTDSPTLEMFNKTDSTTASIMFNQTDSPTLEMFNKTDSPTLEIFNQTDSSTTSVMFNKTDSPTSEMFNQTDSTTASVRFNQTDTTTKSVMFNKTDSTTASVMFNQTDSTTTSVMFNQTDSTTAPVMFNQTDSTTASVMFNKTDSTTASVMFNQTDSTTASALFTQTISTTLGMTHKTIPSIDLLEDKTVNTSETETEVNITTLRNIVSLRISAKMSTFSEADDLCHREKPGSKLFRLQTSADRYFLDKFVDFAAQTIKNSYNIMFWTQSNTHECGAILMRSSQGCNGESLSFTERSWPCDAQLRAVCMLQIDLPETSAPQMEATSIGSEIRVVPGEIQATSRALRNVGGLGTPQSSNDANSTFDRFTRLFIRCNKPADVAAKLYKSGLPTLFAHEVDETGEPFGVDLSLRAREFFPYRDIDLAQSYHCEVMNQTDKGLLRSNSIYVRLSDYEIYSVSLALRDTNTSAHLSWSLLGISLTNTWKRVFTDQSYGTGQVDKAAVQHFMRPLNATVKSLKWMMEPLMFIPERKNSRLVFYIYKPVPGVNVLERDYNTKERLTAFKDTLMEAIKRANLTEFNSTSLSVKSIDWCWAKDVLNQVTSRTYYLPDSPAGAVWKSSQICASDGLPLVTAKCEGDKFIGLDWGPLRVNPLCDYSNMTVMESKVTSLLRSLSQGNVTTDNVEFTVRTVKHLVKSVTETDETLSSLDVNYVADILQKCLQVDNLNQSTVQDVLDTVVEISGSPDEVLDVAQRGGNGINRLLNSVDRLGQKLNREDLSESGSQRLVSGGLAVEVWDLTQNAVTAPVIGLQSLSDGSTSKIREKDLISLTSEKTLTYGNTDVAILLSRDFIQGNIAKANKGSDVRLAMNVYKDTKLFERNTIVSNSNLTLNSKVIAAQLLVNGQPIRNLGKSQVKTVFLPVRKFKTELRRNLTVCAYWDFSANQGRGDWADDGCSYEKTEEGKDICFCDHLTNFAVLVSYYDQESLANDHQLALSIITIVGLSLSIAGLSLSILSFLLIKKLRKGRPQQTLFQLSLALLMSWIVFLAGVHQTDSHAGCITVAALLHYLIMASFMWMLMEGILQYLLFVKVINTYFSGYMLKTSLLAWGLPILPVVIILGINTELYKGGEEYCWMSLDAFYYGFAIPVGLIILTNIIIFMLVVISLCRRKDISKHSKQSTSQTVVNIRASFICFCILGLSWVFGFLAIEDARIIFQYIFCVFASLQGFIIFVMMTARDKQVRKYWISVCCRWDGRTASSKSGTGSNSGQNLIHRPRVDLTSDTDSKCEKINSPNNSTTFTNDGFAADPDSSGNFHSRQPAYETGTCGSEV